METSSRYVRSEVPAGRSGAWQVEKVLLPDRDYDPAADPRPDCFKYRPGLYTCLRLGPTQYMTDLYDEWWTQRRAVTEALARGGDVLITGLGLGVVVEAVLRDAESTVGRVTVVELSPDVIALVAPHLRSRYPGKVEIVQADAFTWEPPWDRHFTVGWHDIWPDPHPPAVATETRRLREHHAPWCAWQGTWPEEYHAASPEGP